MTTEAASERRKEAESLRLLTEQVYSLTGRDFRDYAIDWLRPRVGELARAEAADGCEALRERLLEDPAALARVVEALSYRASGVFQDPPFFAALRSSVVPLLRTYPSVRIWDLGCGTGEETYSLAILLQEEGLLARTRVYATDLPSAALRAAKTGAYPLEVLRGAALAHERSGGRGPLGDHYRVEGPLAVFNESLRERIVFSEHSIASDASFNEFHLVVCRGLLPALNRALQERLLKLVDDSLCPLGLLALGRRHTLTAIPMGQRFAPLPGADCFYRKVR
jgi:chemotaxis protein methyltransferase CheR